MASMMRLEEYQVSATSGFLPPEPPLERLPEYFDVWEDICSDLYKLRIDSKLVGKVAQSPLLDTRYLSKEPEWRRAYVLLGFITNAYIWGLKKPLEVCLHTLSTDKADPSQNLPANIAVPFVAVSEHLEMPPIATYAAQNLWNYRPIDPSRSIEDPDNFCALTTFTNSVDESWFFSIPAAIEARGAPIIPLMLEAFRAASLEKTKKLAGFMLELCGHVEALTTLLPKMYERCDPKFFYQNIRPFLAGTTSLDLPYGVFYEQTSRKGDYRVYQGPTAAQSSLFHFLDISLGIKHRPTGTWKDEHREENNVQEDDEDNFLMKMRQHMPGGHRRFLEDVSKIANIRGYVASHPQDAFLQEAYNAALERLVMYRNKHVQMVSRYIVVPSRVASRVSLPQTKPGNGGREPATHDTSAKTMALGTGGTAPVEFLKQVRNETKDAVLRD